MGPVGTRERKGTADSAHQPLTLLALVWAPFGTRFARPRGMLANAQR